MTSSSAPSPRPRRPRRRVSLASSPHSQDTRDDGDAIQAALASKTGRRTVPNVIIGGRSIGGGDDTEALHREGKLAGLLRAAGALRE